ncbi:hypothetical protein BC826DRAFT_897890, partial [Russula brevipes]
LPPTSWDLPQPAPFRRLVLHHLRLDSARAHPGLLEYTHRVFAAEIEAGRTYPQESAAATATHGYTRATFEAYFWAADVIVAVGMADAVADDGRRVGLGGAGVGWGQALGEEDWDLEASRGGRSWEDALVGFYYVKPNYPGRSSHICNAGFLIPPAHRQFGYGMALGKSYLHYGPLLGYKASVFNLVYANNTGSLRIWDSLGFTRAGLIPRAGRLRRADGKGEEWVDSVIYYRSFVDEEEWE